jgi:hypothetical protein
VTQSRKGARGRLRGTGNKVSSDKELTKHGRRCLRVSREEGYKWRDRIRGCGDFL